jgi:hypothetical protein
MLVLFDHSVPAPLASCLIGHTVTEARERGWDTLSNGDLLAEAERAEFDAFLTADKNIQYQQNLAGRRVSRCGAEHSAMAAGSIAHRTNFGSAKRSHARQLCRSSYSVRVPMMRIEAITRKGKEFAVMQRVRTPVTPPSKLTPTVGWAS